MFPSEAATNLLAELYLDFLYNTRLNLYDLIEENRAATYFENEVNRPALRGEIKVIGDAITLARESNAPEAVVDALIDQIRFFNHMRHDNREIVKTLAFEQSVNKAMLAEISREISFIEAEREYAEAIEQLQVR